MRVDLPSAARNPISLIGIAVATATAVLFIVLFLLEQLGQIRNPYFGLLLFVAVPTVFVAALLLIPVGIWRRHRQLPMRAAVDEWPVIDLRTARVRAVLLSVLVLTGVNIAIVSLAAYGAVHHMESAEFCGTTCHTTMEPEWKAYQVSPHAEVPCVSCHVGPGAEALVASKVAGTRQLWQELSNSVPKPVPSPVRSMRPARETCQACHWSEKIHGDKLRVIREFAEDEKSTETATTLQVHVGGGRAELGAGGGIHWHMNIASTIEYIATDSQRHVIPWVKLTDRNGNVREYAIDGVTPDQLAQGERRRMDCMDCHNRPAHTFEPSPERAVDNAIAAGYLPRELPFSRREAVAALKDTYVSPAEARAGIQARLLKFYNEQATSEAALVTRTIRGVQSIYENNVGHVFFTGCFRCHDDNHKSRDGSVIKQECESCHAMP